MASSTSSCAEEGGCPSDYTALSLSLVSFISLLARSALPFLIHKLPRPKGSSFWLPAIQLLASFNLLLSLVMSLHILKFRTRHWFQSCYLWAVIHLKEPLNNRCHMRIQWIIPVICLHGLYIVALVGYTGAIHHIEFRFHELKDLWRGILVSTSSIVIWIVAYILNEIHEETEWLQVTSRFVLLTMAGILVLAFFSISSSQPLASLMSLRSKELQEFKTMGWALGIPDSGQLLQKEPAPVVDPNEPLDKLLLDKRFLQSFMAFANSCLAGESVHFYDEVQQHDKIPVSDTVRRIYMARHIIEKYITAGASMEVNISHRSRQEILTTLDLAHPDLFRNALNEIVQLMKMNLAKDYWSSIFFMKFKEEANRRTAGNELEQLSGWNFSPRLSSVHCADDPFHQEHKAGDSIRNSYDLELQ